MLAGRQTETTSMPSRPATRRGRRMIHHRLKTMPSTRTTPMRGVPAGRKMTRCPDQRKHDNSDDGSNAGVNGCLETVTPSGWATGHSNQGGYRDNGTVRPPAPRRPGLTSSRRTARPTDRARRATRVWDHDGMTDVPIEDDMIRLGQFLKLAGSRRHRRRGEGAHRGRRGDGQRRGRPAPRPTAPPGRRRGGPRPGVPGRLTNAAGLSCDLRST